MKKYKKIFFFIRKNAVRFPARSEHEGDISWDLSAENTVDDLEGK